MKKTVIISLTALIMMSCGGNESKLKAHMWANEGGWSRTILKFGDDKVESINDEEIKDYEVDGDKIIIQEGSSTLTLDIIELTDKVLRLAIDDDIEQYHPATVEDLLVSDWEYEKEDITLDLDGDGDFTIEQGYTDVAEGEWSVEGDKLTLDSGNEKEVIPFTLSDNYMELTLTTEEGVRTLKRD